MHACTVNRSRWRKFSLHSVYHHRWLVSLVALVHLLRAHYLLIISTSVRIHCVFQWHTQLNLSMVIFDSVHLIAFMVLIVVLHCLYGCKVVNWLSLVPSGGYECFRTLHMVDCVVQYATVHASCGLKSRLALPQVVVILHLQTWLCHAGSMRASLAHYQSRRIS